MSITILGFIKYSTAVARNQEAGNRGLAFKKVGFR